MQSVPNEILLSILEKLQYLDLRFSLPRVSRRFHSLISSRTKKIDLLLFRDMPPPAARTTTLHYSSSTKAKEAFQVHPAFSMICYNADTDRDPSRLKICTCKSTKCNNPHSGARSCHERMLGSCSVKKENAVSPAVSKVVLSVARYKGIEIVASAENNNNNSSSSTKGGVTVMDVMKEVVGFMSTKQVMADETRGKLYVDLGRRWNGIDRVDVVDGVLHLYVFERPEERGEG